MLFLLFIGLVYCSDVLDLTDKNWQTELDKNDVLMVEFYAPWCGHCKRLAPEYEKAATRLMDEDPPIRIAKVDCPANTELCQKYDVSGYPTIKMFSNGEESGKYEGARTADGIVAHMRKQAGPASVEVNTLEKWEKVSNNKQTLIFGFYADVTSGAGSVFMKFANQHRDDYRFAHTTSADVAAKAGHSEALVIYRPKAMKNKFEESEIVFDEKMTVGIIRAWAKAHASGSCPIATLDNLEKLPKPIAIAFYNVDYELDPKGTQYWRNRVMKAGKEFPNMNYAVGSSTGWANLLNGELNGAGWDFSKPKVVVFDAAGKKFLMEEEFTADQSSFKAFLTKFEAGEVTPYIKSAPLPESQGALKEVVGFNWDEIVMNSDADVFIKMYAPWCGHCKSMAPAWEEFAEKMEGDDSIIVANFDATANDPGHAAFSASGYPTIYWAPKDSRTAPVKYQGGRSVEDFMKYVKENRSTPPKDEL